MGNLQPAHHGYRYQDIATAYMLVRGISERYNQLTVDRKHVADDKIDDLEVVASGRCVRRQFKSSQHQDRTLSLNDFTAEKSTVRLDLLVRTFVRAGGIAADEYRLCATWQQPTPTDELTAYLRALAPGEAAPTITTWNSVLFQLQADLIWPAGKECAWVALRPYAASELAFTRAHLRAFCDRFIIEVQLPCASTELRAPGPLEQALVQQLAENIGIGRYPNQGRTPVDVAALAIAVANLARTQAATITPAQVERDLNIRTDFGRIAQAFPLEEAFFHNRPTLRSQLQAAALAGQPQLLVAMPGAGKSWELTRLAEELAAEGAIVARHYCYLEPGDPVVEKRITTNVFFANLLAELTDAAPDLFKDEPVHYAADIQALERAIGVAARSGRAVVLIVDGLDHIARVRADARQLSDSETDIVERLATLALPTGATLLLGSQPGDHLQPLRERWGEELLERPLPPWQHADVLALAALHGLVNALQAAGFNEERQQEPVLRLLAERSEGNPLYARYLVRGLMQQWSTGALINPIEWLNASPVIAGDIAKYYAYLYAGASRQAKSIADVLGVIDFGVTPDELTAILPELLADWVPEALRELAPVLTTVTGQGGMRIFHESFRRFMGEALTENGRSLGKVLRPVLEWLEEKGLFEDAKSYRFLLPALRRAGHSDAILAHIGPDFVTHSVAHAHPKEAIQRNLALAGDVAADHQDWPALARCIELHRSAFTSFNEAEKVWPNYWETYLQLFGPLKATEGLTFDGRPTQSPAPGILACALLDEAGAAAPWRDYLLQASDLVKTLKFEFGEQNSQQLAFVERLQLAVLRGEYRLDPGLGILTDIRRRLTKRAVQLRPPFVRALAALLAQLSSPARMLRWAARTRHDQPVFPAQVVTLLRLGAADELTRQHKPEAATAAAELALSGADTAELATACLDCGARARVDLAHDLATLDIAVEGERHLYQANEVRTWVASVRLLAYAEGGSAAVFARERERVAGEGWYRCWLQYVLSLAEAAVAQPLQQASLAVAAFHEFTQDLDSFRGEPRACDIYAIHEVICETISWGLTLLGTSDDWETVLSLLSRVSREIAFSLDREEGWLLSTETLCDLLEPHAAHPVWGAAVRACIEAEIRHRDSRGTYYANHAQHALRMARIRHVADDAAAAQSAWLQASVYFCAYGFRKDTTVFDLVESIPALAVGNQAAARQALELVQPLTDTVLRHTDGRETKHAPGEWFQTLLTVDAPTALDVLLRTLLEQAGADSWPTQRALRDVVAALQATADPVLLDDLLATLRSDTTYDDLSKEEVALRLAVVERIASQDADDGRRARHRAMAEFYDEGRVLEVEAKRYLVATGYAHETPVVGAATDKEDEITAPRRGSRINLPEPLPKTLDLFPAAATLVDLLKGMRSAVGKLPDRFDAWTETVTALTSHLQRLLQARQSEEVFQLLRFFKRDAGIAYLTTARPLERVAEALEKAGFAAASAMAYALAYTLARGGGGFLTMGDQNHSHLLARALALDIERAQQTVAAEVAYLLRDDWTTFGTSRHLVQRIAEWGDAKAALATWQAAYDVIAHRLPSAGSLTRFAPFMAAQPSPLSVEEGLIALLLAQLAEPRLNLKTQAMAAIMRTIQRAPTTAAAPLRYWLTRDAHGTSVLLVLHAWLQTETQPYLLTQALADVLLSYAQGESWGMRYIASALLSRAGLPAPRLVNPQQPWEATQHPSAGLHWLNRADPFDSVSFAAELWPELPKLLANRMQHLLTTGEEHQERLQQRLEVARGDSQKYQPLAPVLGWDTELLVNTLHAWLPGPVQPSVAQERALARLLPDTRLHAAVAAGRVTRPAWTMPAQQVTGVGSLPTLLAEEPQYPGWVRLATVEHQYHYDGDNFDNPPAERIIILAGAVLTPHGVSVPANTTPFRDAAIEEWWTETLGHPLPYAQLVGWEPVRDWLGSIQLLVPPVALRHLALRPISPLNSLQWVDALGKLALVYRSWSTRAPQMAYRSALTNHGADLIVRPDVLYSLQMLYRAPISELRSVTRVPLKHWQR